MALSVATAAPKLPLLEMLARIPAGPHRTRIEDSPWWNIPGIPDKAAWLPVRAPSDTVHDFDRLRRMLELSARITSCANSLLDLDTVDTSEWDALRQSYQVFLDLSSDGVELPADYQIPRIATALWGDAPWVFWDESLRTGAIAHRILTAEGFTTRDVSAMTLGLLFRDLGWALVYRRLRSPGRQRVMEQHPSIAVSLLNALSPIPRTTLAVIEEHHRLAQSFVTPSRDRYPRGTSAGLFGAVVTRLIEIETALIPSGVPGANVRRLALDALASELTTNSIASQWSSIFQKVLAGTSARDRLLSPRRSRSIEQLTLHSPEPGLSGNHRPLQRPDPAELPQTQALVREAFTFGGPQT